MRPRVGFSSPNAFRKFTGAATGSILTRDYNGWEFPKGIRARGNERPIKPPGHHRTTTSSISTLRGPQARRLGILEKFREENFHGVPGAMVRFFIISRPLGIIMASVPI